MPENDTLQLNVLDQSGLTTMLNRLVSNMNSNYAAADLATSVATNTAAIANIQSQIGDILSILADIEGEVT